MLLTQKPNKAFERTIYLIQNPAKKEFLSQALKKIPEYFWNIPASSTGKNHPSFAVSEHGLVKHTLAAIIIALSYSGPTRTHPRRSG